MSKNLRFDASEVTTKINGRFIKVQIETDYLDEVLQNITPNEIIDNYEDLDTLYELLKKKFE